jgi:cell division protein FtsB
MIYAMPRRRASRMPSRARMRRSFARYVRPLLSLAVLAAGLVLSGAFVGVAVQQTAVAREARAAQAQIDAELARRAQLQSELADRKTDTYVVDKARELGFVRPGESLIAVRGSPAQPSVGAVVASAGDRLARWITLFFRGS